MGDNRISRPSSASAAAVAEAARRAAAEAARRAAEAAARQAAQQAQRAPGTGTLSDQQAVSPEASLEGNTGPLGGVGIAEAPEIPGAEFDFAPPETPEEAEEPTGGAGGPPAPNGLQLAEGGIRDVNNPLNGFRGNFAQTSGEILEAAGGPRNLTPEQQAIVDQANERKARADVANNLLGIATGVVDVGRGIEAVREGDTVEGVAQIAEGGLDVVGRGIRLNANVRDVADITTEGVDIKARDRLGSAVTGAADIAAGVGGIASGISELRDGQVVDGAISLAGGVADTTAGASSIVANLSANGNRVASSGALANFGSRAPTFAGVAGVLGGAVAVSRGVDAIRDGRILEGSVTIAQGGLGSLAGAAGSINSFQSIANGPAAVANISGNVARFAKLGNQFGGAAAIVGGGFQAFNALRADPPDLQSAAVGGANIVGGALLMTAPSPSAAVGGAILIGTALYENVAPVRDIVNGQVGALINVGEGVIEGVGEVAEGFSDAADELLEGDIVGAATEAVGGVVEGIGAVAEGIGEGVRRFGEGVADAGRSIARGIGNVASHL